MIEKINVNGKLFINFKYSGDESKLTMPPETKVMVYRIVQEQVNNIIKHSGATNASIVLKVKDHKLTLIIEDNGKGFEIKTTKKGLGLRNIYNRVNAYGGKIKITAAPGMGCCTKVDFELRDSISLSNQTPLRKCN